MVTSARTMCVIIPVHKEHLSAEEVASLQACYRHLKNYDCFLVFPEGLFINNYTDIHPKLILKSVPTSWLSSLQSYNLMKVNPDFYEIFNRYDFMMTYELDAFILSSNVEEYFGFDYDFIGAPVFKGYMNAPGIIFNNVLNSGFSIRNISACAKALARLKKYRSTWKRNRFIMSNFQFLRRFIKSEKLNLIYDDHITGYFRNGYFNEDIILSKIVPQLSPFFKVAPFKSAAAFSFEVNPDLLYKLNNYKLPLGCHAWPKFFSFWKDFIQVNK